MAWGLARSFFPENPPYTTRMKHLSLVDLCIIVGYNLAILALGCGLFWRAGSSDRFMAAGRSLPGWAVGLSVFGSYISSISFLAMIRVRTVLDVWWQLAGIFSGGMLGLFLLGLVSRRAGSRAGFAGVAGGIAVILWMTFSTKWTGPLEPLRSPFHNLLTLVIGTGTILLVGLLAGLFADRRREGPAGPDAAG